LDTVDLEYMHPPKSKRPQTAVFPEIAFVCLQGQNRNRGAEKHAEHEQHDEKRRLHGVAIDGFPEKGGVLHKLSQNEGAGIEGGSFLQGDTVLFGGAVPALLQIGVLAAVFAIIQFCIRFSLQ